MNATLDAKYKPKAEKGWLTKLALCAFAAVALADLTGCAALKNSADTLGNAAGTQVTNGGLWLLGKDAKCNFTSQNRSSYSPNGRSSSGTVTANVCREIHSKPTAAAEFTPADQQAIREMQIKFMEDATRANVLRRAEMRNQQAVDICHQRDMTLLGQGKKMDAGDACTTVLKEDKAKTAELTKPAPTPSGWSLKD